MKIKIYFLLFIFFPFLISAQTVTKSLNLATAGNLSTELTADLKNTVTNLMLSGNINARDFKCLRDEMIVLKELDMSGASILAFSGTGGTLATNSSYAANQIPEYAFSFSSTSKGKVSLTKVLLPANLTSIANYAFWECTGLLDIIIPNGVTSLGEGSFKGCTNLATATLSNALTKIDNTAFYRCYALKSIVIPGSVTQIGSSSFYQCTNLAAINIPNSVKSIGNFAFEGCGWATTITIGSGIETIGTEAFKDCLSVTALSINRPVGPVINTSTFSGMKKWEVLFEVPVGRAQNYKSAPGWVEFSNIKEKSVFTSIVLPEQNSSVSVVSTPEGLLVNGLQKNELITVYTITGSQIFQNRTKSSQQLIPLQKGKIYLVKTNSKSFKVSL
ncbi:MAG: leucine-rich repeat domain-containing protein [Prolixibacteraceae bacterium]|nr:leucine-rich repeat domain-containing protein [Prolixibacteraceae bacterium]